MTQSQHELPIGQRVIYVAPNNGGDHQTVIFEGYVVQHSRDVDGTPLYMVAQRPVAPPPDEFKLYSLPYLVYRLHAGCYVGNTGRGSLVDRHEKVKVPGFFDDEGNQWTLGAKAA